MEAGLRKQSPRVVRLRPPGVRPLEIWDLEVTGGVLWEFIGQPSLPLVLCQALEAIHQGRAGSRARGLLTAVCQDFDAAYITGGASVRTDLQNALVDLPFPVFVSSDGAYCGERGGLYLLSSGSPLPSLLSPACGAMVVDVGQSAVKLTVGSHRFSIPRDWRQLPLRDDHVDYDIGAARRDLRSFLGTCIRHAADRSGQMPSIIVLGLPCELDDHGLPGESSYVGMLGDAGLAHEVVIEAGLLDVDVLLLNDAELAALSAACDPAVDLPPRTLIVTLGFGVGAALLARDS